MLRLGLTILAVALAIAVAGTASAQPNVTLDSPFQVRAVPKLKKSELITFTNTGATNANVCANVYAFDPQGQMVACCSCLVAPNTLRSLAIGADVFEGTKPPKAGVLKTLTSIPVAGTCNAAAPAALATGLLTMKGELPFVPATLSAGELSGLTMRCTFLNAAPVTCVACRE
jgi:hypothetical protein